jgi:hypothetical protein
MAHEQVYDPSEAAFVGFGLPAQQRDDIFALAALNQHSVSAELRQAVSAWLALPDNARFLKAVAEEKAETQRRLMEGPPEPADAHVKRLQRLTERARCRERGGRAAGADARSRPRPPPFSPTVSTGRIRSWRNGSVTATSRTSSRWLTAV